MRTVRKSEAFDEFYDSLNERVKEKIDYVLTILIQMKVVSSKFIKKLDGTDFYELRVSVGNEYRIIVFTIDDDNFIEADEIFLLNGFLKKSTKDYKKQVGVAEMIIKRYFDEKESLQ